MSSVSNGSLQLLRLPASFFWACSHYPHFQMVSLILSHSETSIKKTLIQVLIGLARNASTLMPSFLSMYHLLLSSWISITLFPPCKYQIMYHLLFKSREVNEHIIKRGIPSAIWSQLLKFVKKAWLIKRRIKWDWILNAFPPFLITFVPGLRWEDAEIRYSHTN